MTLGLDLASAMALREFAQAMPIAVDNIVRSTEELVTLYQTVADCVGPHDEAFGNMIMLIKSAQETASDAISKLPDKLEKQAELIEDYIKKNPTI